MSVLRRDRVGLAYDAALRAQPALRLGVLSQNADPLVLHVELDVAHSPEGLESKQVTMLAGVAHLLILLDRGAGGFSQLRRSAASRWSRSRCTPGGGGLHAHA